MSLLTDVQAAAATFSANVAELVTQEGYLEDVITGPSGGVDSLVNVGPRILKTLSRTLLEIQASKAFIARGVWSSGTTYADLDGVSYNGVAYVSMSDGNLNHQPDTSPLFWMQLVPSGLDVALNTPGGGFYTGAGGNIHRVQDRLFVGEAAAKFLGDGFPDGGTSWFSSDTTSATFIGANARLLVTTDVLDLAPPYAIAGAAKLKLGSAQDTAIALGGAIENYRVGGFGWAGYLDAMHGPGATYTYGLEISSRNVSGVDTRIYPSGGVSGNIGLQLSGGGDPAYGPTPSTPATAGLIFTGQSLRWNHGIVFLDGSLTDGVAVALSSQDPNGPHQLIWFSEANIPVLDIYSVGATNQWGVQASDGGFFITKDGGLCVAIDGDASTVNWVALEGHATGVAPRVFANGADTNVDLQLDTKGSGIIKFGNANMFRANGSVATVLGSVGPSGSHTTVQEWLQFRNNAGTVRYVPGF